LKQNFTRLRPVYNHVKLPKGISLYVTMTKLLYFHCNHVVFFSPSFAA